MADQGPGGFDIGGLLAQAQNMQEQLTAAQDEAAEAEVTGVAGGGAVKITVTGGFDFRSVSIDPAAVDPAEVDLLEDLVLAALNDASSQIQELQEGTMGALGGLGGGGGLGDMLGGLGLGGLFGADDGDDETGGTAADDDTDGAG